MLDIQTKFSRTTLCKAVQQNKVIILLQSHDFFLSNPKFQNSNFILRLTEGSDLCRTLCKNHEYMLSHDPAYTNTSPITVIEGLSLPSFENIDRVSSLAKGLLGLGSLGVPSTLVHIPTWLFQPMILSKIQQ